MNTSKSKVVPKPKKTTKAGEKGKSAKVATSSPRTSEEEIRKKAEEIYHQRIARGEKGTAADDWHKAEKLLKKS